VSLLCTVHHNFGGESRSLLLGPKKIFRQGNNNALVIVYSALFTNVFESLDFFFFFRKQAPARHSAALYNSNTGFLHGSYGTNALYQKLQLAICIGCSDFYFFSHFEV
jgi:hypothetical protein